MVFNKLLRVMSPVSPYGWGLLIMLCVLISLTNQTTTEEPRTTVRPYNQVRIKDIQCSDEKMTVNLLFSNPFRGRVYTKNFPHIDGCGLYTPDPHYVIGHDLDIEHYTCGSQVNETSSGFEVKNRVRVRFHQTIRTKYDTTLAVSCTVPEAVRPENNGDNVRYRKQDASLDIVLGSELNPEPFNGSDHDPSSLYLKVTVAKKFRNSDIVVRNCIAHNKQILDDNNTLCQMNDYYACDESDILDENFRILNEGNKVVKVLKFKDPAILTLKPLFITCGINVCQNLCDRKCNSETSLSKPRIFTHFASKAIHLNRSTISDVLPQVGQDVYSSCLVRQPFQYTFKSRHNVTLS